MKPTFQTLLFALLLCFIAPLSVARADVDPQKIASGVITTWLESIDAGHYAESWTAASPSFHKAITSDKWVDALTHVRTPLGPCKKRVIASAMRQTEIPTPTGTIKGDFIVVQFNTSFQGLAYAVETVTFEKASDGTYKAAGYYVKPN